MPHTVGLVGDRVVSVAHLKDVYWHVVPVSDLLPTDEEIR
jgi:hypothetical protein